MLTSQYCYLVQLAHQSELPYVVVQLAFASEQVVFADAVAAAVVA